MSSGMLSEENAKRIGPACPYRNRAGSGRAATPVRGARGVPALPNAPAGRGGLSRGSTLRAPRRTLRRRRSRHRRPTHARTVPPSPACPQPSGRYRSSSVRGGRALPRPIHDHPHQHRPLVRDPRPPPLRVASQVVVAGDAIPGRPGIERLRAQRAQRPAHGQRALGHTSVLSRHPQCELDLRPRRLDERGRERGEQIRLLVGHPDEPGRGPLAFGQHPGLPVVPVEHAVRRREADAGAGRPLVPDRPVVRAQIDLGAGRRVRHAAPRRLGLPAIRDPVAVGQGLRRHGRALPSARQWAGSGLRFVDEAHPRIGRRYG